MSSEDSSVMKYLEQHADSEPMTFAKLVGMVNTVKEKVHKMNQFAVPGVDGWLDLRDYELREVGLEYWLVRRDIIKTYLAHGHHHPASYIWLRGASLEMILQLRETHPHLMRTGERL